MTSNKQIWKADNDVLGTIFEFPFDTLNNYYFRGILYLTTLIYAFLIIIQSYYMLYVFNADLLSSSGTLYSLNVFHLVSFLVVIRIQKEKTRFLDMFRNSLWDIKNTSHTVKIKIFRKSKLIRIQYICFFVYNMIQVVGLIFYISEDLEKIYIPYYFVQDYCPRWLGATAILPTLIVACVCICVGPFVVIYLSCHLQYQLLMIRDHLRQITEYSSQENNEMLIHDELYQANIKAQLRTIVKRHGELVVLARKLKQFHFPTITAFIISSVPVAISCTCFALRIGKLLAPGMVFVSFSILTFMGMNYGQQYQDEFTNIFAIYPSWYTWNTTNRRTYLLFLCNALQPINLNITEKLGLNYLTLITMYRAVFTTANILYSFYKR